MSEPAQTPIDPEEAEWLLLRHLRTRRGGLTSRDAERRLVLHGRNELRRRGGLRWPRELADQFTHPLALVLYAAAALAFAVGNVTIAVAIMVIVVLNAAFAFAQESQAERAVEALARYLPPQARVLRDGKEQEIEATALVPGDVLLIEEGDRISADARLIEGAVEVDMSTLTGESAPVVRSADLIDTHVPLIQARDIVFSGTSATGGEARGLVFGTGMQTEIGRIAALSERVKTERSPLEKQVRHVAWVIAAVASGLAIAFVPLGIASGLSATNAVVFSVGLLAGNVPEGLLPVITLSLAIGVRELARRGAVVKRLSAVETLGSTSVICTDKTGTLTENRMRAVTVWTPTATWQIERDPSPPADATLTSLAVTAALCNNARDGAEPAGDPTEVALLALAERLGASTDEDERERNRRAHFHFDPALKLMTTVDEREGSLWVDTKGAPEAILERCTEIAGEPLDERSTEVAGEPLDGDRRRSVEEQVDALAGEGLRVLAIARRQLERGADVPARRESAERDLCLLGLIALFDPPRAEVAGAVASCHGAGIRVVVVTGDHGLTAAAVARRVGIAGDNPTVVTGEELAHMSDERLDGLLREEREVIFARSSPEAKLRIADSLRAEGYVIAMTGDGVNDAPALRAADIGVAMGRSGTDVAREASTMVLADDNFATIVAAVDAGRRVFDNVRKFMTYIFAHTTPEVVPFLVFALGGGAIPLPLTVPQLLAFDVGSETLPALALGREPAEPGLMRRRPRPRSEGVIDAPLLLRAWLFLGLICAALQMAGYFWVLTRGGWSPGDPVGAGDPLNHLYREATTMTFFGMMAGQIGTSFAVRTTHASLRSVGVFTNRPLLLANLGVLLIAALFIYAPPFQSLLGTVALTPRDLLFTLSYPFIVWGADELRRYLLRRRRSRRIT